MQSNVSHDPNEQSKRIPSKSTYPMERSIIRLPLHKQHRVDNDNYPARNRQHLSYKEILQLRDPTSRTAYTTPHSLDHNLKNRKLTSDHNPLTQRHSLHKLRPRILQRCAPTVFALQPELVFRRQFRHIRWPLALWLIRAVVDIFERGRWGGFGFSGEPEG